jgi:hypothetical protein
MMTAWKLQLVLHQNGTNSVFRDEVLSRGGHDIADSRALSWSGLT